MSSDSNENGIKLKIWIKQNSVMQTRLPIQVNFLAFLRQKWTFDFGHLWNKKYDRVQILIDTGCRWNNFQSLVKVLAVLKGTKFEFLDFSRERRWCSIFYLHLALNWMTIEKTFVVVIFSMQLNVMTAGRSMSFKRELRSNVRQKVTKISNGHNSPVIY